MLSRHKFHTLVATLATSLLGCAGSPVLTPIFTAVTAKGFHTCGVEAGAAYCWGGNFFGEVGDGTTVNQLTPVPVLAGGRFFTAVSAGYSYTCGLTAAGDVYCW